jgi:hypothetical protein
LIVRSGARAALPALQMASALEINAAVDAVD